MMQEEAAPWFWRSSPESRDPKPLLAVFLQRVQPWHTGVVFRDFTGGLWRVDLAFHHELQKSAVNQPPQFWDGALWVEPREIDPLLQEQLAELCSLICTRNSQNGLAYALRYDGAYFDQTGDLKSGPDEHGLTCATFVLALFANVSPLIDLASWPAASEEDLKWQQRIVEVLGEYGAESGHVDAVRAQVGCIRVRPPEVAAASSLAPPSHHEAVLPRALVLEQALGVGVVP